MRFFVIIILLFFSSLAFSDDSEIYFSQVDNGGQKNSLIMTLDNSASLRENRIPLLNSINRLIDSLSGIRVGMVGFYGGGFSSLAVGFPVADIDDSYCNAVGCSIVVRREVASNDHDGYENSFSQVLTQSSSLGSGTESYTLLRFPQFNAPSEIEADQADLNLIATNSGYYNFEVKLLSSNSAREVKEENSDISNRWSSSTTKVSASGYVSVGTEIKISIIGLINELLSRSEWCGGQDLAVIIKNKSAISIAASEHPSYHPAQLEVGLIPTSRSKSSCPAVNYGVDNGKGSVAQQLSKLTVKEELKKEISSYMLSDYYDYTPSIESTLETLLYISGEAVRKGRFREGKDRDSRQPIHSRIAHSASYNGGNLSRSAECHDFDLNNSDCVNENITGNAVYKPVITHQCHKARHVLITDGEFYQVTDDAARLIKEITGSSGQPYCPTTNAQSLGTQCMARLVGHMAKNDLFPELPGVQSVQTDVIGFNVYPRQIDEVMAQSGGDFYHVQSTEEILDALTTITEKLLINNGNAVGVEIQANAFDRLTSNDNIYLSLFQPTLASRWLGNIRKYQRTPAGIVGKNNVPAFVSGSINPAVIDLLSTTSAGSDISNGGVGSKLSNNRIVYSNLSSSPLTAPANRISRNNPLLTTSLLSVSDEDRNTLVDWVLGKDTQDYDEDNNLSEAHQTMGAIVHSNLVVANYGVTKATANALLFAATSDGYLHAFDEATGVEVFSFIPNELLSQLNTVRIDSVGDNRPHGLDGQLSIWYSNKSAGGDYNENGQGRIILFFGLRRSGSSYYALDITNRNQPELLWNFDPINAGLTYFGQSWSKPQVMSIPINNISQKVVLVSGGYDASNDESRTPGNASGNTIALLSLDTGQILWHAGGTNTQASLQFNSMEFSIPATPKVLDLNQNGNADRIYVGDLGGQLWRFDVHNSTRSTPNITGGVIASVSGASSDNYRRFFAAPDASLDSAANKINVAIGSGWASHPLDGEVGDRFYLFKDQLSPQKTNYRQLSESDLYDATSNQLFESLAANSKVAANARDNGWFLRMQGQGEKVVSESLTLDGKVLFTTYKPALDIADPCVRVAQGATASYLLDLKYAFPVYDVNSDNVLNADDRQAPLVSSLLPSQPQVVLPEQGYPEFYFGLERGFEGFLIQNQIGRTFHLDRSGSN
ncbi:pilus assembly protein [Pelagibaculum spongiae]|uniref:PilY1 beta-propeller domain-containing protein n=1 Tax=Pelagibaculum spongiae TaxID=2080658 RepID=A0A2V1GXS9_9GAMM|nr:PilC/PilY family type IV pilus protein [Pelagibaculum spongiae]PVZ70443.1 hypothetical protein DC094_07600 [Pelagibaculum spongiae]